MSLRRIQSVAKLADVLDPAGPPMSQLTFDEVYEAHVDFLWRNARRLGVDPEAVDDVLQQVFIIVHRRLRDVSRAGSEKAWLFGILLRVVRDHKRLLRRKSPHRFWARTDPESLTDDRSYPPDESLFRSEAAQLVQRWLCAMSDDKREVFILAELEQMTAKEIAEATGANANTVYSRLRVARQEFEAAAARYRTREAGGGRRG
jgi:RNA polymerase sigma-70 factor (ECF subfamily)